MGVNSMDFQQSATILAALMSQATGQSVLAPQNLGDYISVGQKALRVGYDPLNVGISQMVSRTIYALRNYESPLKILARTGDEYGAIVRKVNSIYQPVEDAPVYKLVDGQSVDPWKVRKPKLYQTNFYGFDTWDDSVSVTRVQLKNAVLDPNEMGRLMGLILGTKANEMRLSRETFERATLANAIAATRALNNAAQNRHLLTEYNAATGLTLTATTVKQPANFAPFMKWAYARIGAASDMLRNMSSVYHLNPVEGAILRHTPKDKQRLFVYNQAIHDMDASVLADTFNASMVSGEAPYTETLDYFQSMTTPDAVNVTPAYINANGALVEDAEAVEVTNIFAVLFDADAVGTNYYDSSVDVSPFNSTGKYWNYAYHDAHRYFYDATENMIIFTLD